MCYIVMHTVCTQYFASWYKFLVKILITQKSCWECNVHSAENYTAQLVANYTAQLVTNYTAQLVTNYTAQLVTESTVFNGIQTI